MVSLMYLQFALSHIHGSINRNHKHDPISLWISNNPMLKSLHAQLKMSAEICIGEYTSSKNNSCDFLKNKLCVHWSHPRHHFYVWHPLSANWVKIHLDIHLVYFRLCWRNRWHHVMTSRKSVFCESEHVINNTTVRPDCAVWIVHIRWRTTVVMYCHICWSLDVNM